jgi:hypothetical protein
MAEKTLPAAVQEAFVESVSTRSVDGLAHAIGLTNIANGRVSRLFVDDRGAVTWWPDRRRLAGPYQSAPEQEHCVGRARRQHGRPMRSSRHQYDIAVSEVEM